MDRHPYITVELATHWLTESITGQAEAAIVGTTIAYRLTTEVYKVMHAAVDGLEDKWRASREGMTGERQAAMRHAAGVLRELWEWLLSKGLIGTEATDGPPAAPARLPDTRKLVRDCEAIGKAVPLEEFNPTIPLPVWVWAEPVAASAREQKRPDKKRREQKRRDKAKARATAGLFDG